MLEDQPDALAAIRAVAFIDDALRFLLESHFAEPAIAKDLLGRTLRDLAARTKVACALRLISPEDVKDVDKLRGIRNKCAHTFRAIDLSDETFSNLTKQLSAWDFWTEEPERKDRASLPAKSKERLLLTAAVIARDTVSPIGATRNMTKEETQKFIADLFRQADGDLDGDDGV